MRSKSVSYVKAHFAEVIATVRKGAEPLMVTQNGAGSVVIQDVESYEETRKALLLLKIVALGEREIEREQGVPHAKAMSTLRARLGGRRSSAA